MDLILDRASDSVRAGARLSGLEERMLDGTVEVTSSSREDMPMDWSISLVSSSLGPTVIEHIEMKRNG